ncbi:hypothetical protein Tco_0292133 [Tanacetum coccineum]
MHDNIVPKLDLALELGKSISLTEAEEEVIAREVHATHARIMSESEPEPTQRRQSGIAFRDSFIVSKKRSSDSSKKLKGIQTLTPAEQEAADIMKALKESKKMSKRQVNRQDAMDKEVAVKVKDHKRKHDSDDEEDDDDDEGPSAGSNQGRSAKRRRPESAASGSVQPPSKDDHQSSKKPRESDASASKQHPALTLTGWQITDTRDDVVNSLMHMLPNNIQITDTSPMHMPDSEPEHKQRR